MVFSSVIFLFYFLPIFFFAYYLAPRRWKNTVCLLGSLFFYAWGEPYYVLLMLGSITVNYLFGRALEYDRPEAARRRVMIFACLFNLALLFVFKYLGFFVQTAYDLFGVQGKEISIALPLGISFYTFQAMSYIFDVYREQAPVQRRLQDLALYISMFPQLVAGPIVRYGDISREISERTHSLSEISAGITRFLIGAAKKILIANVLGEIADTIWATANLQISTATAWIGVVSYTLQIYFDFSGYSDMAIGLGRMMGFHFVENFKYPYLAGSISEFWRRWHISLGTWFKDYLFYPVLRSGWCARLGKYLRKRWGKKTSRNLTTVLALLIVWSMTGFWHGANWTFLLWGLYYGVLICIEDLTPVRRLPAVLRHIGCLLAIMLGYVIFRSDSVAQAGTFLARMLGIGSTCGVDAWARLYLHDNALLFVAAVIGSTPLLHRCGTWLMQKLPAAAGEILRAAVVLILLSVCTLYLVNSTYNPFIYFRF